MLMRNFAQVGFLLVLLSAGPALAGGLSQQDAEARAKRVSDPSYQLHLWLDESTPRFNADVTVRFTLKDARSKTGSLWLDFSGGAITLMEVNGKPVPTDDIAKRRFGDKLYLRAAELAQGTNTVRVAYSHAYSEDGGFYRFKDPEDGLTYITADLEPFRAHELYPCFDQPDLKATYTLTTDVPASWTVVSSVREAQITPVAAGTKRWRFPETQRFSTYVFTLAAGPFAQWSDETEGPNPIPLRLFVRQSLKKFLERDVASWFDVTKKGLAFFAKEFDYPYPFQKYDQIVVPDLNEEAMENVGAVTFTEDYVSRSAQSPDSLNTRNSTILHEMSHMWFGNLVTMRWWDDLWLNESFADLYAATALETLIGHESWKLFYMWDSSAGLEADALSTTHPIRGEVKDTDSAFTNFDGISYGKGAAVVRQLRTLVGEDKFRNHLRSHFKKFAYSTATLDDFLEGLDVKAWTSSWIQTAGSNTVQADWACDEQSKISVFRLLQSGTPLRTHSTQIATFANDGAKLDQVPLEYSAAVTEVPALIGKECPSYVFPNEGAQDYVRVQLDPTTRAWITSKLGSLESPLRREMFWYSLWDEALNQRSTPQAVLDIILSQAVGEQDSTVLRMALPIMTQQAASTPSLEKYLPRELIASYRPRIESFLREGFRNSAPNSGAREAWWGTWTDAVMSPEGVSYLKALLSGRETLEGFELNADRRWVILESLARAGDPSAPALIAEEKKTDHSDTAEKSSLAADASYPSIASKEKWFRRITRTSGKPSENELPLTEIGAALEGFQLNGQEAYTRDFVIPMLESLLKLRPQDGPDVHAALVHGLYPAFCDAEVIEEVKTFIHANPSIPTIPMRALVESLDDDERCLKIRESAGKG